MKIASIRMVTILLVLIFAGSQLSAQEQKPTEKDYAVDCTTVQAGQSCKSYNELVNAKDQQLLGHLQYHPFVCFLQDSDTFVIITLKRPPAESFRFKTQGVSKIAGTEFLARFKDGVADDLRYIIGSWNKTTIADEIQYFFNTPSNSDTDLSIDDSEIGAAYQFTNLYHTTTQYTLKIRRSTKRFVETYEFPDQPSPVKKGEPPHAPTNTRTESTGYCAEFQ